MDFPKRNEIWLVSLEPVMGREIGKTRPALVSITNSQMKAAGKAILIHLGIVQ